MKLTGEEYYRAGTERMRQAREIHDSGTGYALAMHTGGLAVECMLRGFRWIKDKSFEGRHDLEDLLKSSELLTINDERSRHRDSSNDEKRRSSMALRASMSEVVALWHNNLRFAPDTTLRAFLRTKGRLHGVKGNALKKNSTDLLNAAQMVIDQGGGFVDLKEKVETALKGAIAAARIRLEDDDGISGFVVSPDFRGMSALDRQSLIDKALRKSSVKLTKPELRQILAIAALTPAEYETVDLKEPRPSRH